MDFLLFEELFTTRYYAVPDYQRDYEWTNAQTATMLDDIFQILENNPSQNHFFGALVTIPFDKDNATSMALDYKSYNIPEKSIKHIVDGQQRLTTFSLLILTILNILNNDQQNLDPFSTNIQRLRCILYGTHYINLPQSGALLAPKLLLNRYTGNMYNDLLYNPTQSKTSKFKGPKRLISALKLFEKELPQKAQELIADGKFNSLKDFYFELIRIITENLQFVEINCTTASDAFQVFDSLNGKGLDLTAADRIKNIFMSWAPPGKGQNEWDELEIKLHHKNLTSFFVSLFFYNSTNYTRIPKNKLPDQFKLVYRTEAIQDFMNFSKKLQADAEIYANLRTNNIKNLKDILNDFSDLGVEQIYVLLFSVLSHYGNSILTSKDFKDFLTKLFMLIIRMQICDKSMNKLDRLFSKCIKAMKENSEPLSDITQKIINEAKSFVPDDTFKAAFKNLNTNDSKVTTMYLRHIETYLRRNNNNGNPVPRDLTVEHIIPQSYNDLNKWYANTGNTIPDPDTFKELVVENIGNKLLLYGPDNAAASNSPYQAKQNIYKNGTRGAMLGAPIGTFELVKDLLSTYPTEFTHLEVERRAESLADLALKVWPL